MKYISLILSLFTTICWGQMNIDDARKSFYSYKLGSYEYHEQFVGHAGYGAPIILTADGGAAFFGSTGDSTGTYGLAVKIDREGKEEWQQAIRPQFDEIETQSIVQDETGNFYVFLLSYDTQKYRGGCERIVCLDKYGAVIWDKIISECQLVNNPTIAYIRALDKDKIELRGHMSTTMPRQGQDPEYRYWEGLIDKKGRLTQKVGDVINWADDDWQKLFEPEKDF